MRRSFIFLSTPSARRATRRPHPARPSSTISIHALREEGDRRECLCPRPALDFYPRPPRGGRLCFQRLHLRCTEISIHALREEGDGQFGQLVRFIQYFYPRPPRGGRPFREKIFTVRCRFLSTPSARRATYFTMTGRPYGPISIHALREEGDGGPSPCPLLSARISIHALREEGDSRPATSLPTSTIFLSTPSARRATAFPPGYRSR